MEINMIDVTMNGRTLQFKSGVTAGRVVKRFFRKGWKDILLVKRGSRLLELTKKLDESCTLHPVTIASKPGMQTYERSAIFMMLKSFLECYGEDVFRSVMVDFSLSGGLFCRIKGQDPVDPEMLRRVEKYMRELSGRAVPIRKRNVPTDDAIRLFRKRGLKDKETLFGFRVASRVNLYELDGSEDYFYGYMVPDTSYIRTFAIEPFRAGFILRLPSPEDPDALQPFNPPVKIYEALLKSTLLADKMQVDNVGNLNKKVAEGKSRALILCHEALMEKRIGDIAQMIAERKNVRFVMIAGPSSSGKTTFSNRLCTQLLALGLPPHPIETDNYFKNREDTPKDEKGEYDFESLGAMDVEGFNNDMMRLMKGERVELPRFNFKAGRREYNGNYLQLGPNDILVIEGIHCLNDALTYKLPTESKFKIYISSLTQMNVDNFNRIPTTDARLLRRMTRDARTRGISAEETLKRWPSVRRGEEKNIFPFQDSADVVFDSSLVFETAVLKPYVEPLLFAVPRDSEQFIEAKRLLKFLDYYLTISADDLPRTSLLREFVGGGLYND